MNVLAQFVLGLNNNLCNSLFAGMRMLDDCFQFLMFVKYIGIWGNLCNFAGFKDFGFTLTIVCFDSWYSDSSKYEM